MEKLLELDFILKSLKKEINELKETIVFNYTKPEGGSPPKPEGGKSRQALDPEIKRERNRIRARLYKRKMTQMKKDGDTSHVKSNCGRPKLDIPQEVLKERNYELTRKWKEVHREEYNTQQKLNQRLKREALKLCKVEGKTIILT